MALDYIVPEGRDLLYALIERADALVINVRPGVEQRLGLDEATLRRLNPKLVFCYITGFGADGPYAKQAAYDNVGQAASGLLARFHNTPMRASPGRPSRTPPRASSPVSEFWARCWSAPGPAWGARSRSI